MEEVVEYEIDQGETIIKETDEEVAVDLLSAAEFLDATSKFAEKQAGIKSRMKAKRAVEHAVSRSLRRTSIA